MPRARLRESGRIILAHGEVTGHCHEVVTDTGLPPDMEMAQYFEEPNGRRTLMVLAPCLLRHQEHAPIPLDPDHPIQARQGDVLLIPTGKGTWDVRRQAEETPDGWFQVAD